jgi:type I restriction enzyme, S subunit
MIDKITKLPKDWKLIRLKDICEVVTGTTPPKSDMSNYGNDIPFFKPPHLWDGLISTTDEMLSLKGATKARVVPPNTVLVTCIGNLGRTGFVKKEAAFNQQINAILENDKIDGKYIFYQAQSPTFRNQLEKLATGTTVSIVNKGNFETITILLAPPETQQAIVSKIEELFSELDKGIEDLKTAQQQLKTYRQSVLKWAFEGKLTNENVKDGELPKGWEKLKIKDVCEIKGGKNQSKVINPNGKYPIYGSSGIFGYADEYICGENTTIVGRKGNINSPLFVTTKFWNVDTAFGLCVNEKYDSKLLFYFCLGFNFKKLDKSTTIPSLAKSDILSIDIQAPPIEEQHRIVQEIESRLSVADKMEESIAQSLQQAEALRQSILKKAFSGQLL